VIPAALQKTAHNLLFSPNFLKFPRIRPANPTIHARKIRTIAMGMESATVPGV
jgi:hypothetical protein